MKYRDGGIITKDENNKACGALVKDAGYSEEWYGRIVNETGDHYEIPSAEVNNIKLSKI